MKDADGSRADLRVDDDDGDRPGRESRIMCTTAPVQAGAIDRELLGAALQVGVRVSGPRREHEDVREH
ncbi:hypothetical protein CTKZ_08550 [Cellulomonas algicola]|uniref:Uncharacterized protein n=1 Tax=Cellulomonas algicola TaxID=2071633 RepID=A0A401UX88_9CELL|nr:hypothetical protein [Cellulomonas algicola]GCD19293.1 hypothetical protein CTKZ_08550 [Cellulomonas algicola]